MTVPFRERISCTVADACTSTGLGRTKLYELIELKKVAASKVGGRTLIDVRSLVFAVGAAQLATVAPAQTQTLQSMVPRNEIREYARRPKLRLIRQMRLVES